MEANSELHGKELLEKVKKKLVLLLEKAYAPYSGVKVAAAVITDKGNVYYGVNVENASLGLTICAERAAIASMVASGERRIAIVVIASNLPEPLPPCGACRQVIAEFAESNTLVVSFSPLTLREERWRLEYLLPKPGIRELILSKRRET